MKNNRLIILIVLCITVLLLSSCGDRDNEESESTGTSQVNLVITSGGTETFTSDEGYTITMVSGSLDLGEVSITGEESEDDGHDHDHKIRHDDSTSGDASCHFEGPFEINLANAKTDLGFVNTDPGTYSTLNFIYGEHSHEEDGKDDEEEHHHEGSIKLEGTAVKDGVSYSFHVTLNMEEEIERTGFSLELERGLYGELQLYFGVHHWFQGVDISQAPLEDGVYHINIDEAPELAERMMENARTHVRVDIPEE